MKFEDRNLELEEGEEISFPVDEGPLLECQEMRPIKRLEDVRDFQFVQEWAQAFELELPRGERDVPGPDLPEPPLAGSPLVSNPYLYLGTRWSSGELLGFIRERTGGQLMTLALADFIVPIGSTVVLTAPLSEVTANTVVIAGELKFTDDLVIRCNEIRGS